MSRHNSAHTHILDRPLGRGVRGGTDQSTVSLSAFALLYSELVQYHQSRVASISELERRLESAGYGVGLRVLELLAFRSSGNNNRSVDQCKREIRLMSILQFVSSTVWKSLFGKAADSLERSIDHSDEYMIVDYEPLTSTYVSVPSDLGQLSVDAYISGIISGVLEASGFPARVTAHSVRVEEGENVNQSNSHGGSRNDGGKNDRNSVGGGSMHGGMLAGTSGGMLGNIPSLPQRKDKAVFLVKFSREVLARDAQLER